MQGAWSIESLKAPCPLKAEWAALEARHKRKSTIVVHIANKMLSIGWILLRKKELYNGLGDFKRAEENDNIGIITKWMIHKQCPFS